MGLVAMVMVPRARGFHVTKDRTVVIDAIPDKNSDNARFNLFSISVSDTQGLACVHALGSDTVSRYLRGFMKSVFMPDAKK